MWISSDVLNDNWVEIYEAFVGFWAQDKMESIYYYITPKIYLCVLLSSYFYLSIIINKIWLCLTKILTKRIIKYLNVKVKTDF